MVKRMKKIKSTISEINLKKIDEAVTQHEELYATRAHFVRCAVIRELRRLDAEKKN